MLLEFNTGILHRILDDISQSALEHFYKEHLQRMSIECGHAFLEEIASLSVAFALLQDPVLRTICGAWPHARPSATSRNDFEDLRIDYLQSLSMIIYFAPFSAQIIRKRTIPIFCHVSNMVLLVRKRDC